LRCSASKTRWFIDVVSRNKRVVTYNSIVFMLVLTVLRRVVHEKKCAIWPYLPTWYLPEYLSRNLPTTR
jgi:hypothetical protein